MEDEIGPDPIMEAVRHLESQDTYENWVEGKDADMRMFMDRLSQWHDFHFKANEELIARLRQLRDGVVE